MKKVYCVICGKHRKFKNPKISCSFGKTVLSISYNKCKNEGEKYLKKNNNQLRH